MTIRVEMTYYHLSLVPSKFKNPFIILIGRLRYFVLTFLSMTLANPPRRELINGRTLCLGISAHFDDPIEPQTPKSHR